MKLTLDTNIQYLINQELNKNNLSLLKQPEEALLMNVDNGEILSLISLPNFDINLGETDVKEKKYLNKITRGVYELGSIFKNFYDCISFRK